MARWLVLNTTHRRIDRKGPFPVPLSGLTPTFTLPRVTRAICAVNFSIFNTSHLALRYLALRYLGIIFVVTSSAAALAQPTRGDDIVVVPPQRTRSDARAAKVIFLDRCRGGCAVNTDGNRAQTNSSTIPKGGGTLSEFGCSNRRTTRRRNRTC
jgi:hypothetical protein